MKQCIDPVYIKRAIEEGSLMVTVKEYGFPKHKGIFLSSVSMINGERIIGDTVRIGDIDEEIH